MASFSKFNQFTADLLGAVHNFSSHTIKVVLTNSAPTATNTILSNITQIANGNGYTTGGSTSAASLSTSSGTAKVTLADVTFTATGAVGPFRYVVIYNDTPTSPADPLIGYYDNGSNITLANGDTFTVDFDATNGTFTVA